MIPKRIAQASCLPWWCHISSCKLSAVVFRSLSTSANVPAVCIASHRFLPPPRLQHRIDPPLLLPKPSLRFKLTDTCMAALPPPSLTALATHTRIATILPADIYLWRGSLVCPCSVDQPLLDIAGQAIKGLVNVDVALCRDLEEGDSELISQSLALFCRDGALLFPIALVTNEDLVDTLGGVLFNVGEPCANVW